MIQLVDKWNCEPWAVVSLQRIIGISCIIVYYVYMYNVLYISLYMYVACCSSKIFNVWWKYFRCMMKYFVQNCFVFLLHRPVQLGGDLLLHYFWFQSSREKLREKNRLFSDQNKYILHFLSIVNIYNFHNRDRYLFNLVKNWEDSVLVVLKFY